MKKRVYVIIGILGHVGNTIARILMNLGLKIRGLALPKDDSKIIDDLDNVELYRGDITKPDTLDPIFTHKEDEELYVIHAAGIISLYKKYSPLMYKVNVEGTKNIIEKCKEYKVAKLLYISSVHAIPILSQKVIKESDYFNKDLVKGAYAKTKAEATELVLKSANELDVIIVHPSGIIGPYDNCHNHLSILIKNIINEKLRVGINGGYDFVDVRDIAFGCYQALLNGKRGECYILSNKRYTIKELFNIITTITKQKRIKVYLSIAFVKIFAWICELYYKTNKKIPLFTSYSLYTLNDNTVFSHDKATRELSFNPRPMEDTVKDTIYWMESNNFISKPKGKSKKGLLIN